ncbi:hypothetical protein BH23BAC2_BH23BAC2_22380 [soil metagenome]
MSRLPNHDNHKIMEIMVQTKLSNYQLKQLLESNYPRNKNEEDLIKGIISVDTFTWKGVKINFAEILRRLKRII